ncbi:hypothetical protein BG005_012011, partial [Podila minutissima]
MFFGHFYPPPPMPPTPAIGNNRPVNTTVPFEDYQLLDKETFYRRYGFPNRPVMLYNSGVEAWSAWKQWTLEALLEKYGDAPFRVSNLDGEEEPYFPLYLRDFYQYPPHIVPPGHDPESPKWLSSVEWYLDVYPFLAPEARPIEVVQNPGQTIYVPTGWWHMVLNMDDTVAVTQNFADETNILQVKDSMLSESE